MLVKCIEKLIFIWITVRHENVLKVISLEIWKFDRINTIWGFDSIPLEKYLLTLSYFPCKLNFVILSSSYSDISLAILPGKFKIISAHTPEVHPHIILHFLREGGWFLLAGAWGVTKRGCAEGAWTIFSGYCY